MKEHSYLELMDKANANRKIHEVSGNSNVGIMYWTQSALEDLTAKSGPLAARNEYQIHYWSLVMRLTSKRDKSIIDLGFPTVVFNYLQYVSGAHVDFELSDVNAMSEALKVLHTPIMNKLFTAIKTVPEYTLLESQFDVEFMEVALNTMHRHPTGVSSFSGTDLRKNHVTDTGVVFPLATGDNTPSFSSIIYNNPVKMIRTEYRLASGAVASEAGITYKKGFGGAFIYNDRTLKIPDSWLTTAIKYKKEQKFYYVSDVEFIEESYIHSFFRNVSKLDYTIDTQFISADNVKPSHEHPDYKSAGTPALDELRKRYANNAHQLSYAMYSDETIESASRFHEVDFHSKEFIQKMDHMDLAEYIIKLENIYYGKDAPHMITPHQELMEAERVDIEKDAVEMQELILEEYQEFLNESTGSVNSIMDADSSEDIEVIKSLLASYGVPQYKIDSASESDLRLWHSQV